MKSLKFWEKKNKNRSWQELNWGPLRVSLHRERFNHLTIMRLVFEKLKPIEYECQRVMNIWNHNTVSARAPAILNGRIRTRFLATHAARRSTQVSDAGARAPVVFSG